MAGRFQPARSVCRRWVHEKGTAGYTMAFSLQFNPLLDIFSVKSFPQTLAVLRMTLQEILERKSKAQELLGNYWFNGGPVSVSDSVGEIILLEFWDYTCTYCARALPYVKEWYRRYRNMGLTVVGVHTPKFPFGKNPEYVHAAIERQGVEYPVVMDNESLIWMKYGVRAWPTMVLIDRDGFVRYHNIGEGDYLSTERLIQARLHERGLDDELPMIMEPIREEARPGATLYRVGLELYGGYLRGSLGNVEGYVPEAVVAYRDPKIYFPGRFYAEGNWLNDRNSLRLSDDMNRGGQLILSYEGAEVDAVLKPEEERDFKVFVTQDDQFLSEDNKGEDVQIDSDGRSYLVVDMPRLYHMVKNREYGEHILRLRSENNSLALFSFTFVPGVIPELISKN